MTDDTVGRNDSVGSRELDDTDGDKDGDKAAAVAEKAAAEKAAAEKTAAEKTATDEDEGKPKKTALSTDTNDDGGEKDSKTALSTDTDEKDKDGSKDKDSKKNEDEGAPEKYADFTLPEGMKVDETSLEEFGDIARDLNLSQENAQKLINLEAKRIETAIKAHADSWDGVVSGWLDEAKADKEIGGDKYNNALEVGKGAIKKFGTPALVKALDDLGVGNHPEFIRFMYRVGKATGPDETHVGQPGGGGRLSLAERMFPTSGKK